MEKNTTMSYTTILKKGEGLLLRIYKNITNKSTSFYRKLTKWFPVLNKYSLLRYSLIPLLIALFILLRYVLKFIINEIAASTSVFVGETTGYTISESTIVFSIAAVLIISRIIFGIRNQKKEKWLTNGKVLVYSQAR